MNDEIFGIKTDRCKHCLEGCGDHVGTKCLYGSTSFERLCCHTCRYVLCTYHNVFRNGDGGVFVCTSCMQPGLWTLIYPAIRVWNS